MRRFVVALVVALTVCSSGAVAGAQPVHQRSGGPAVAQDAEVPDEGVQPGDEEVPSEPPQEEEAPVDDEVDAAPTDIAERDESVSRWWWALAILLGLAATAGLVSSLRRRGEEEDWFERAGTACDTGRSVVGSLTSSMESGAEWPPPARFWSRFDRFSQQIEALDASTPPGSAEAASESVRAATVALRAAIDAELGADDARHEGPVSGLGLHGAVEIALGDLVAALETMERAVLLGGMGAAHPARRPSS